MIKGKIKTEQMMLEGLSEDVKIPRSWPRLAFTTRLPLAVLIAMGRKRWENRSTMPDPPKGKCLMTVSQNSTEDEYYSAVLWYAITLPHMLPDDFPPWEEVKDWRGKIVAKCDYEAMTEPDEPYTEDFDEGYPIWWKLSKVKLLKRFIPCKGSVGMWKIL